MPWYAYILYAFFILSCLILVGVVLLQPGKSDAAAIFGGGSQTAFGPRGAQKPLGRVTFIAAGVFMVLSFLFSLPGVTSPRPASSGIQDAPVTTPPPAPPVPAPNPAGAPPATTNSEAPKIEVKPAEPAATTAGDKKDGKTASKDDKPDAGKDAKPKPDDKKK